MGNRPSVSGMAVIERDENGSKFDIFSGVWNGAEEGDEDDPPSDISRGT